VSHKRPTLLIDLTGSDDENPPLAKRVQHKALGSSSGDYLPLGVSAWNSSNEDTAGIVRNYTPYVSKLPPAYIPQVQCRPPPLSKTGYFSPYFTSSISGPSSYSTPRPMMIQSREQIEIEEGPNIVLTTEQEAVVRLALSGENLFLTGAGGSGKTITLRSILAHLQRQTRKYQVIAPTAIAALPLNGKTTYSFFGWNPDTLHEPIQDIIKTRKSWVEITAQSVEVLIIEEISMVENQFLERMNLKMQAIFNNVSFKSSDKAKSLLLFPILGITNY
jgi:Cdc6-like AAA superfamily ATPase